MLNARKRGIMLVSAFVRSVNQDVPHVIRHGICSSHEQKCAVLGCQGLHELQQDRQQATGDRAMYLGFRQGVQACEEANKDGGLHHADAYLQSQLFDCSACNQPKHLVTQYSTLTLMRKV